VTFGPMLGPLGSYRNFISHIALENFQDYWNLKWNNLEEGNASNPVKYKEFRYFLNAAESLNNILDYFYFEYESSITHKNVESFRSAVHKKFPELEEISNIANAYKHRVRVQKGLKNPKLPWAKDLQRPKVYTTISFDTFEVITEYIFHWPIPEQEAALKKAFQFWSEYHNEPFPNEITNA